VVAGAEPLHEASLTQDPRGEVETADSPIVVGADAQAGRGADERDGTVHGGLLLAPGFTAGSSGHSGSSGGPMP
jgi:hypothetical protein